MVCVLAGLAACSGDAGAPAPPQVTLTSIAMSPPAPSLAAGTTVQLSAVGMYSNATTADLSAKVTWSSSSAAVATVNAAGLVTGVTAGTAEITATSGGQTGHATVTVTSATLTELQVTPASPSLAAGTTTQLTAMAIFTDHSNQDVTTQVTWTSDNADHATVSATGKVTAVAVGDAKISATMAGVTASVTVTTTAAVIKAIIVAPVADGAASIALGFNQKLTATALFTDDSAQDITPDAAWTSSAEGLATVDAVGLVTSHGLGTATITATLLGASGALDVTITDAVATALKVTVAAQDVPAGLTVQFTATGTMSDGTHRDLTTQVTWTPASDDPTAVVSNADGTRGLARTRAVGQVTVSATLGAVSDSLVLNVADAAVTAIAIAPPNPTIGAHRTIRFQALGSFTDLVERDVTTKVTWTSDDITAATISNADGIKGLATGGASGVTTIHAAIGPSDPPIEATTTLTVTPAVLQTVTIASASPSVPAGLTVQLTATGHFDDNTQVDLTGEVTWASLDPAIAQVAANGVVTGLVAGSATITATAAVAGVPPASFTIVVDAPLLEAIAVAPETSTVPAGTIVAFTATGTFSDGSHPDITRQVVWAPADDPIVAVASDGTATTKQAGTVTVTATLDGQTGSATLIVDEAAVVRIDVLPADPTVLVHSVVAFHAQATLTDGSKRDLTAAAIWGSSDTTVATIVAARDDAGLATTLAAGVTTITATIGEQQVSSVLTVTPAVLQSIAIDPPTSSVAAGLTSQLRATGSYNDGTTADLSGQVTWGVADPTVATVSPLGLATGVAIGTTQITAAFGEVVSPPATFTVTAAVAVALQLSPATVSLTRGGLGQLTATLTSSDATRRDVSTTATWRSDDPSRVTVSGAGQVAAVHSGTVVISAVFGELTATATVTAAVGPVVTTTLPRNTEIGIRATTPIIVGFDQVLTTATLTTQTTDGACTGSLQLSSDGFASCVGFTSATPSFSAGNTMATVQPAAALAAGATYQIRVLDTVANEVGDTGLAFTLASGFTTTDASGCANRLVISQVYGGGGLNGSAFDRDFIELHNGGPTAINLADYALHYALTSSSAWQVVALPAVTIPAGRYFLIAEGIPNGGGAPLPVPDASGNVVLQIGSGKVALSPSAISLPAVQCPLSETYDIVGYGAANCAEGTAVPTLGTGTAAVRKGAGCADTDGNLADFDVGVPTPRNGITTPVICACP